ncbi:MAG: hypothetical protein ACREPM_09585 [Gemmatimonadaceae bacterium]
MMPRVLRHAVLALAASACGGDTVCVAPCPLSLAVTVNVTSATAAPLPTGVFLNYTYGNSSGGGFCSSGGAPIVCELPGPGGTYQIAIGAPGFQTQSRTANVTQPETKGCGCALAQTQHFDIALVPD